MTKEQAKELLPIIQAFVDGKTIQYRTSPSFPRPNNCDISYLKEWFDLDEDKCDGFSCDGTIDYRIKTEPKYRPFKNANECFEEIKKHEPFGWVKNKQFGCYMCIGMVDAKGVCFGSTCQYNYQEIFDKYTFIDGTPFGIKEDYEEENNQ